MVYALSLLAALIVASGEVVQQRTAAGAPPSDNLSPRLLLWLVRRPRWLAGVAASLVGNLVFAAALNRGNVILVEAVFVSRLVFGLTIAAVWGRRWLPVRELAAAVTLATALAVFLLAASPRQSTHPVEPLRWVWGTGGPVTLAVVLMMVARPLGGERRAMVLGAGAGLLFGVQAALVQKSVSVAGAVGIGGLLSTWPGYATVVVALFGMLLVQSAFESGPLRASYPAVVIAQLLCATFLGVVVLGGAMHAGPVGTLVAAMALATMVAGVLVLGRSPLVTGDHHHPPAPPPSDEDRRPAPRDGHGRRSGA